MTTFDFRPVVDVLDANVRVGVAHNEEPGAVPPDRATLLRELDDRGVRRAIVYHAHASSHSARVGWQLLQEFVGNEPRLIRQLCALPTDDHLDMLGCYSDPSGHLPRCSVRLACAGVKPLPFLPAIYGPMLRLLESRRIPLWIDLAYVELRDLIGTLGRFPHLPVVLVGAHYVDYLIIKPLLRALPTAHLELSRYEAHGQVEVLAAEFGAERLIYGSGFPSYAMGPILYYLHCCPALTQAQLAMICGGNVERLLGMSETFAETMSASPSPTVTIRKPPAPLVRTATTGGRGAR